MDEHTPGLKRHHTDTELRTWTVTELYDLAGECEVEPADESICDACAAYLIAQEKEAGHARLAHEFALGATDANTPQQVQLDATGFVAEQRLAGVSAKPGYTRPWLFLPGDKVLCLVQTGQDMKLVAGVVQQVRIPGPMRPNMTVQVQPEDGFAAWWDPDQLERLGSGDM